MNGILARPENLPTARAIRRSAISRPAAMAPRKKAIIAAPKAVATLIPENAMIVFQLANRINAAMAAVVALADVRALLLHVLTRNPALVTATNVIILISVLTRRGNVQLILAAALIKPR